MAKLQPKRIELTGSDFRIMSAAFGNNGIGTATVMDVFHGIYATSEQPLKKVTGLHKQMTALVKRGLLRCVKGPSGHCYTADSFSLTAAGLKASRSFQDETLKLENQVKRSNPWKIG